MKQTIREILADTPEETPADTLLPAAFVAASLLLLAFSVLFYFLFSAMGGI